MAFSQVEVRQQSGAIGAEILGVDLAAPFSPEQTAFIRAALLQHQVLFFRDQKLSPEQQLAFSRRFGALSRYPFVQGMDAYPDIVEVIKREDETVNFGGVWHSDTTYLEEPPLGSTLLAKDLPPRGGDTWFSNMYLAYDSLSAGLKRLLGGLKGVNTSNKASAAAGRAHRRAEKPGETAAGDLVAIHPVVRTHPETGKQALFINAGHTERFDGFSIAESAPLLEFLCRHLRRPEFTCCFRWHPGSMAFWDNRAAQHYAVNDYHGFRRVMHRVTIQGDRPM